MPVTAAAGTATINVGSQVAELFPCSVSLKAVRDVLSTTAFCHGGLPRGEGSGARGAGGRPGPIPDIGIRDVVSGVTRTALTCKNGLQSLLVERLTRSHKTESRPEKSPPTTDRLGCGDFGIG